jgi:hypothetical protein
MTPQSRPRRVSYVLSQRVSQKLILLNSHSGAYYDLDGVGARIWELCDGSRTVADAVAVICTEYEADATTVEADVLELLHDLSRECLIEEHQDA